MILLAWADTVATVLLFGGAFFMLMAAVGVVRFPDFYSRLHAAGKGDTLGQGLVLSGLLFVAGLGHDTFKLLLIAFFVFILNATATHALARAAWLAGVKPWRRRDGPEDDVRQFEGQMTARDREALFDEEAGS